MKRILVVLLCFAGLVSCGRYNVDFPPPSDFASLTELFPEKIDGKPMMLTVSGLDQGLSYAYQGIGSIWVYRANDTEEAALYFDSQIMALFQNYRSCRHWVINGARQVQIREEEGFSVGWTNGKWVFLLRSSSERGLKKLVESYPWIE